MKTLLIIAVLVAAGWFAGQKFGLLGSDGGKIEVVEKPGTKAIVATLEGGSVHFEVTAAANDTYMLFGASAKGDAMSHGSFAGVPLKVAQDIMKRYPDFYRCDSPGAKEGQRAAEDIRILTMRSEVRKLLAKAASEHKQRVGAVGGARLCVRVTGDWLALDRLEKSGTVLTAEQIKSMIPAGAMPQLYIFADDIELRDCKDLM